MGFLKLLLNISLILISTTVFYTADTSEIINRLPKYIKPHHYDLQLMPVLGAGKFYGTVNITFYIELINVAGTVNGISLHTQELKINEIETTLISYQVATYKPVEHRHDNVSNILTLIFDRELRNGFYILFMEFLGNFTQSGPFKTGFMEISYLEEDSTYVTLLAPNSARRLFPCFDEPALKSTFNISVRHPPAYKVFSNMPTREKNLDHGLMWTHFHATPVMSTYFVGIVMLGSNFVHVSYEDTKFKVWCRQSMASQARFLLAVSENITSLLDQYTNTSVKTELIYADKDISPHKIDHVIVHDYPVSSMNHWGLIIYNESDIYYNRSTFPPIKKYKVTLLIAHELVLQWFGNLVTPSWWSYLWLSEGLAVFFETYFLNKVFEQWRLTDLFVVNHLHTSLALDYYGLMQPVTLELNKINYDMFGFEVYYKAPVILRMLHHVITDEVFQTGIRTYLTKHQFESVTPDNLWSAMQSALESYTNVEYRVKEVMDTWMNQNCYPVLNVTRNYVTGEVTITQKCFCANNCNNKWWIPITFATQINPDFPNTEPNHWLKPDQTFLKVEVNVQEWIMVNVQQTAYCRVFYDTTNLYKIIDVLNSENYTNIHVLNRAQLIDDTYVFWMENFLNKTVFFNLIRYLSRETNYVAWYPMFRILTSLSPYYPLPESRSFKSHVVLIFDKLLQNIGYAEHPKDANAMKMLRLDAAKWACTFNHFDLNCRKRAEFKLTQYLMDPNTYNIPPHWEDWTYCFGLSYANKTLWDKVFELYRQTRDKKFWKYLACPEDTNIIFDYLDILAQFSDRLSLNPLFNEEETSFIFKMIIKRHANSDFVLDYIFTHLHIKPIWITTAQLIKFYISVVSTDEQIDKLVMYSRRHFSSIIFQDELNEISKLIQKRKKYIRKIGYEFTKKFWKGQTEVTN